MKIPATIVLALALTPALHAADGLHIDFLGTNNTLVRVDPTAGARYLILPVQESNDDAGIHVLVDGRPERTIYVRLAKTKVDYTVPFDLTPYAGHNVTFNIITNQSRTSVREAKEDACWNAIALADTFDTANREKFRPAYHHSPLYGWMNDPNGMVYDNGRWHLYYQWNPYGSKWQNMTWGHSSSTDLVNWEHHGAAIEPNGLGSVFSGSAAADTANTAGFGKNAIIALYTSAGVSQIQSMAYSLDGGMTYHIYEGNPVSALETEARDPNMFFNRHTGEWNVILAHPLEHEMLIFGSENLKDWQLRSAFGKGLGARDGVWECPDLFELPVEGENGTTKWVLLCNINPGGPYGGSATQYFTGDFDGTTFTPDRDARGEVPVRWLDYGKDNYASVSWSDAPGGRRTIIGWMNNWQYAAEVPTAQFRSANTLPREIGLFRAGDGMIYASTNPSPEVGTLRESRLNHSGARSIKGNGRHYALPADGLCEIVAEIDARNASEVMLTLGNSLEQTVSMSYDPAAATFSVDRRAAGISDFSNDFPAVTTAPTFSSDGRLSLRIFIDRASTEVFGNEGHFALTNLVFPDEPYTTLTISGTGGNPTAAVDIYSLKTIY